MKTAVFPGSFDPITLGHYSIVERAIPLFDKIVVAVGSNSSKNYMFSLEERLRFIKTSFGAHNNIEVTTYKGLTIDFCNSINANYILRGIRSVKDFEFEQGIAQMNKSLAPNIETVVLYTSPELAPISSTIVRDIHKNGGDISAFIPKNVVIK